jgi:nucleotide-binding universal stress UspA family protein
MYDTILLTLDASPTDRAIVDHIKSLATIMHSRVVLLRVVTSVPAQWSGANAGGEEIEKTRAYLEKIRAEFEAAGVPAQAELAYGDPVKEIVKWVEERECDLLAMGTHGHRLLGDLFLGATASRVQHSISIPVLLLRSRQPGLL